MPSKQLRHCKLRVLGTNSDTVQVEAGQLQPLWVVQQLCNLWKVESCVTLGVDLFPAMDHNGQIS